MELKKKSEFILKLEKKLSDLCTSQELVALGIFGSEASLSKMRKKGKSPDYIQFGDRSIKYPKESVIEYIIKNTKDGSKPLNGT